MNGTMAIARRELAERRTIIITAAILAVIPFAMLLSADLRRLGPERVIAAGGAFVAAVYTFALALLLGATFIGRDLAEKRLSFYFSKPVAASSIWFGKLGGNLAVIFASAAVILVPAIIAAPARWSAVVRGTTLFAIGLVAVFLLAHAIGTMFRSRSPLILADVACTAVTAAVVYGIYNALTRGQSSVLRSVVVATLAALFLLFLIAAGAWQLSRGRIDALRGHREYSRFFWSAVGVTLAVAGAFVFWVVSVTPDDLGTEVWAAQPPAGQWVMLAGPMKHRGDYAAGFYVNLQNGAYARADSRSIWWHTFFTPDGRVAGQLRPIGDSRKRGPVQLDLVRFGGTDVKVTPTEVTFSSYTTPILDSQGTRVAAVMGGILTVQSLPDGRSLAAVRLPRTPLRARLFFTGDGRLRVYAQDERRLEVFELDFATRRLVPTGSFAAPQRILLNANADASRLLVPTGQELVVLDGRTAAVLATIPGRGRGVILSDGRVVAVDAKLGKLTIYGTDYKVQREIALAGMRNIPFLREVDGGTLIVAGHRQQMAREPNGRGWTVFVIDLATGGIVRTARDLRPMTVDFHLGFWQDDPRRIPAAADMPFVFRDRRGSVVLWDAATDLRRAVTRASMSLPAAVLTAVLNLQPLEQGAEVIDDCGGIHLPLAR